MKKIIIGGCFLFFCFFLFGCGSQDVKKTTMAEITEETGIPYPVDSISGEPEPEPEPMIYQAKLSVVGDLMVHDYQYKEAYNQETGEYDFSHNFQDMKPYFEEADLVIGNFETVLAGAEVGYSDYPCFNTPDHFLDAVKEAGFGLLTTANNHCMDKGEAGLLRTLERMDSKGIQHVGTYASQEKRDEILIQDVNGIKIAFLSYTYGTNGIPVKQPYQVNLMTEELIKQDLQRAKEKNPDLIVVLPHMGNEYETYPREVFQKWADFMFENGADLILASHPHVLQRMEYRDIMEPDGTKRTGFIMYSLGNFISSQTTPPRNASIILNIELKKIGEEKAEIEKVSFVPIWTQFRLPSGENHFVVRSVYQMLSLSTEEQNALLRPKDLTRLKEIHSETTSLLLNREIPLEQIQDEYEFPKPEPIE